MARPPAPEHLLRDAAWLRNLATRLVGADGATDLEQDVVVAALTRPQPARERSWLSAVARNLAATVHRRRSAERRQLSGLPSPEPSPSAAELAATAELQQRAVAAVLALPRAYRDTILLRFFQGLPMQAAAAAMGVPEETARTRQRRALAMLRERLAPNEGSRRLGLLTTIAAWSTTAMKAKPIVIGAVAVLAVALFATLAWQSLAEPEPNERPNPPRIASAPVDRPGDRIAADDPIDRTAAPATPSEIAASGAAATTGSIVVRASHSSGSPASGLAVLCRPEDGTGAFASTDSAGEVVFEGLEPGGYRIQSQEWTSDSVTLAAGNRREVELTVNETQRAHGIVLDSDGRAVVGATILVSVGGVRPQWSFPAGTSDRDGRFELGYLRTYSMIGARHPDHGTSPFRVLMGDPKGGSRAHAVTLRLPNEHALLRGRVVDPAGKPIAGAWVRAGKPVGRLVVGDDGHRYQAPPIAMQTTNSEGAFEFTGLTTGDCPLTVFRRGYSPHRRVVSLTAGNASEQLVVLPAGATLVGSVRDRDGQPIADAEVGIDSWQYPQTGSVDSDADGAFEFRGLELGRRTFEVKAPGYAAARRDIEIAAGAVERWDVVLAPAVQIRGRLTDAHDQPLAGWWVAASRVSRRSKTDAEGRFVIDAANVATCTLLVRDRPGFAPIVARFENVATGTDERIFVIGPEHAATAHIRGRALDFAGNPLADVSIQLSQDGWPVRLGSAIRTVADGTFTAGPLPPGRYRIQATHERFAFRPVTVTLTRDQTTEVDPLTGARPARLTVELTGDPTSIDRARCVLVAGEHSMRPYRDGRVARFDRVHPGTWRLRIDRGGESVHDVTIELPPGADERRMLTIR